MAKMTNMTMMLGVCALGLVFIEPSSAQSCGCTADETCCKDDQGYACCIDQTTYCVAPNSSVSKDFPARCCPQWTVGCQTGSVGCCDPARPWQRTLTSAAAVKTAESTGVTTATMGAGPLVYALFSSAEASDLNALTIDSSTGAISKLLAVTGPAAVYLGKIYGEETRVFPFDPTRNKFFFFDINQQTASPTSAITMYAIDPATATSTATLVKGATGFVMSFEYHPETATMVMAVGMRDATNFNFYSINLDTAVATQMGFVERGASESTSPTFYAGYISAVSANGTTVFRLGYKEVTQGTTPGLGTVSTTIAGPGFWNTVPSATGEEFYYSLVRPKGGDSFLSLAPSTSFNHTLAVVQWSTAGDSKVVADIPNAHPPGTGAIGILGYVADDANDNVYVAMTVQKKPGLGARDRWEVVVVDRTHGNATSLAITGHNFDLLGAETVSCSGVGIDMSA